MAGQATGTLVELTVGDTLVSVDQGDPLDVLVQGGSQNVPQRAVLPVARLPVTRGEFGREGHDSVDHRGRPQVVAV